ncbi:hypothetical protein JYU34_017458 [Plutella xylostella]|uniref:Uncharacterized protein n=2 Tax=Plutella xylostella TaxID=51655 RepID=A0ABQ7Q512_PLUXY|nr:cuticle protein 76 [Plutella xylostella]KAG7298988.1 hypothetical protein JYU34_017458 [Plutella xylostella]CAG9133236.1 unnamed protein product [Plutella xylostella]
MFKILALLCVVACSSAAGVLAPVWSHGSPYAYGGYGNPYSNYPAQPALATQHQNTYRSPFNLGQISTYSKTVDTPFSSVSKSDVRVSNPGVALAPAYHGIAPAYHGIAPAYHGIASPVYSHVGVAPVAKVATTGLLGVAYSAAPAVSHMTYTNGLGLAYAW